MYREDEAMKGSQVTSAFPTIHPLTKASKSSMIRRTVGTPAQMSARALVQYQYNCSAIPEFSVGITPRGSGILRAGFVCSLQVSHCRPTQS
jgi:hypothetical protein